MTRRSTIARAAVAALALVAMATASSPAAILRHPQQRGLDLVASAQATSARPHVVDLAVDSRWLRGSDVTADAVATTSAECDGCSGESATLQVLYVPRAERARLDNTATTWTQACTDCTGTALSVQVVVLRGQPQAVPNNRALSVTAACTGCRTASAAFQVVVVARRAEALSAQSQAELRAWFDEQAATLRALVAVDPVIPPTTTPSPTPSPTAVPTDRTIQPPSATSTSERKRARRDPSAALDVLTDLVTDELGAVAVISDVEVSR